MVLRLVRRRWLRLVLAGVSALLFVVPAQPAAAGAGVWTPTRLFGGSVMSLAVSPADPSIVLAGTGGNGMFRCTDGGASWHRSSA